MFLNIGKVYMRFIIDMALVDEDYVIRVYNNEICDTIDNYTNGVFYELSYIFARTYKKINFND